MEEVEGVHIIVQPGFIGESNGEAEFKGEVTWIKINKRWANNGNVQEVLINGRIQYLMMVVK